MKADARLVIAGMALVLITGLAGFSLLSSSWSDDNPAGSGSQIDETFHFSDFTYGPQAWAPYYYGLPMVPGTDPAGNNSFRLMLIDLNITSRAGGSPMGAGPAVIDYSFTGLRGAAAFHLYGYNRGGRAISWTNRADGAAATGFCVFGPQSSAGDGAPGPVINNFAYVKVANSKGPVYDDYGNGTYFLNFNTPGKGLNALMFSREPNGSTEVISTTDQTGRFYVTYDSGNGFDDVLLLVALNGSLSDDFEMHIKANYAR